MSIHDSSLIGVIDCRDEVEFMDTLSPRAEFWKRDNNTLTTKTWIFRGQADSSWSLIPSALRKENLKRLVPGAKSYQFINALNEIFELLEVVKFAELADRNGLHVPGYDSKLSNWGQGILNEFSKSALRSLQYKSATENNGSSPGEFFPPLEFREMFAMAQHYGIPTRFLDWSESSYIAAYFAVTGLLRAFNDEESLVPDRLTVWAFNPVNMVEIRNQEGEGIELVAARWHNNPNLKAQQGIFTLYEHQPRISTKIIPLDQAIIDLLKPFADKETNSPCVMSSPLVSPIIKCPVLRKITLPKENAKSLLKLLHAENISAATVFPGYSGVAAALEEKSWLY